MATLTGQNIANTYKQLLQIGSDNAGLTASVQTVQDGSGTNSALQLSQSAVNINGTFQLNGTTLTATASALNAVPDITAYTGFIAVSGTNINGRTLTGGTGVSISNADGTEGNPVIALNTTGVTSGTYGPATNFEVNAVGQVVSAGVAASVSVSAVTANTFVGGTFEGTTGNFSSNVSVGGDLTITGAFSPAVVSTSAVNATTGTFSSTVSAAFFYGDGSNLTNVPSAEGGTVKTIEAGQGIKITVDGAVSASIPVSGTVAVSADQNFGTVSVSTALAVTGSAKFGIVSATNVDADELFIAGVSAATVTEVAAVSALTQVNLDSITSINTVVANVSALTSVNAAAITSINAVIEGDVSADSGTFNTLTVITSASIGGTLDVSGDVNIGDLTPPSITGNNHVYLDGSYGIKGSATTNNGIYFARHDSEATVRRMISLVAGSNNIDIGDTDVGNIAINVDGTARFNFTTTQLRAGDAAGPALLNEAASSTNPTLIPNRADTDTGIGWASADALTAVTGGSERMRIDSSGKVGIGISSGLADLLTVSESPGTAYQIRIDTNGGFTTGNYSGIEFTQSNASRKGEIRLDHTSAGAGNLVFGTSDGASNADRFHIQNTGVWVENAAGPALLNEAASSTNPTLVPNRAAPTYGIGAASSTAMSLIGGGVETLRWNSTTLLPKVTTQFIDGSATAPSIAFASDTNNGFYLATTDTIGFSTGGSERMRIDSSGDVGIGTTAPDGNLNVQRTAASAGWIINGQTVGVANDSGLFMDSSNNIEMAVRNGSGTLAAAVRSSGVTFFNGGDVGIGTASPARPLHISASDCRIRLTDSDADTISVELHNSNGSGILSTNGASSLLFQTNNAERLRIDSSGNVGIGTSSPNQKLTVGGSASGTVALQVTNSTAGTAFSDGIQMFINDTAGGLNMREAYPLQIYVNGSERMRITSSGNVGIGTTSPAKQLEITKSARATITSLTDATSITSDFDAAQNFAVTLAGNRTLANPSNIDPGQTGSIFVVQDGTGGRTLSFGSYWKFAGGTAPTMSTGAAAVDRIDYVVYTSTAIHAVATLNLS